MNPEVGDSEVAAIERALGRDPAQAYATMDALSQQSYLDAAMRLARRAGVAPLAVAEMALSLAAADAAHQRRRHVGYYLVSKGRFELMANLGIAPTWRERVQEISDRSRLALYLIAIGALSMIATSLWLNLAEILAPRWMILVIGVVCFAATTHLGLQIINQCVRLLFPPKRLPRLNFDHELPDSFRTLVAVPCMLTSAQAIGGLVRELESLYLGNADRNLGFCLVTDFLDAEHEHEPGDAALLETAVAQIESLNGRHGGGFVLLHRRRTWNEREGAWMGWERKRGKLEDLNAVLAGQDLDSHFYRVAGDLKRLESIRFVITLDDDMGLQSGDARRMIGALAHPLNLPAVAADATRVEDGYGLLQPSLYAVSTRERLTRYERLYGTIALSADSSGIKANVYQDLFEQASYCGKGIYDVNAFHRVLHCRFPENLVLSHDMLEGAFIRAGLLSDVVMSEEFPATYLSNMRRRHRWLRGDWQTMPWLLPLVPGPGASRIANRISPLGAWFTFDNVRRILAPVAQLVSLLLGLAYSARPAVWAMAALGVTVIPVLSSLCLHIWLNGRKTSVAMVGTLAYRWLSATSLNFTFIVYESKIGLDAILRSSYRMFVSKRRLLEWIPQCIVNNQDKISFTRHYLIMWPSPALAVIVAAVLSALRPAALPAAAPFMAAWLLAPAVAWWLSRPSPSM